ncbi:MAG: sugar phosphate isomerase/epimerase [Clostridiales bacterium]|jgi:sugar phosphate isomerase/epimerase|nr:sugar phosphate isomerase/epimerase [Clostridiales bacterium]
MYRLANVAWGWTPIPENLPKDDSLFRIADKIKEIGFEGVDYLTTQESIDKYFTERLSKDLGDYCRSIGLPPNVLVYQSFDWHGEADSVKAHWEHLEKHIQIAQWIGCNIVSCLSVPPRGAARPHASFASAAMKRSYNLPDDYDYEADWNSLAESFKKALKLVKTAGMRMSIECFPGTMVSTPEAMVKMTNDVGDPDFGIQLDTNHLVHQSIDPEFAINIVGGKRIFNVHCKDHDGVTRGNIPCGTGIIDYQRVIHALEKVGYEGSLTIEQEFTDNPRRYNLQGYEHIRKCLAGTY